MAVVTRASSEAVAGPCRPKHHAAGNDSAVEQSGCEPAASGSWLGTLFMIASISFGLALEKMYHVLAGLAAACTAVGISRRAR